MVNFILFPFFSSIWTLSVINNNNLLYIGVGKGSGVKFVLYVVLWFSRGAFILYSIGNFYFVLFVEDFGSSAAPFR